MFTFVVKGYGFFTAFFTFSYVLAQLNYICTCENISCNTIHTLNLLMRDKLTLSDPDLH